MPQCGHCMVRTCSFNILNYRGELNNSTQRLLVDWLELLDPEMISLNPTVEESLLFGSLDRKVKLIMNLRYEGTYLLTLQPQ